MVEEVKAEERAYARPWASPTTARVPAGLKALARRTPSSVILFCACGTGTLPWTIVYQDSQLVSENVIRVHDLHVIP